MPVSFHHTRHPGKSSKSIHSHCLMWSSANAFPQVYMRFFSPSPATQCIYT